MSIIWSIDHHHHPYGITAECDISVSKLLGFKTFPIFKMVLDWVSKKFGIEKSIGFGIEKIW